MDELRDTTPERADILLVSDEEGPLESYISGFIDYCLVTHSLPLGRGEPGWPPFHPPHLGIAVLAAHLRAAGFRAEFLDNVLRSPSAWDRMLGTLRGGTPVLGISTSLLFDPGSVGRIAEAARGVNPRVRIVIGGASARRPGIREIGDFAVTGPGERPLRDLMRALGEGLPFDDIPGLWRRSEGGMRRSGEAGALPMDEVPSPDWSAALFRSSLCYPIETSRGCPHRCAFCSYPDNGGLSLRKPEVAVAEMARNLENPGIRLYRLMDSDIAASPDHAWRLCDLIVERGLDIRWTCYARADSLLKRPGLAAKMRAAGCEAVFLGLESGDEGILRAMGKGYGLSAMREGIAALRGADILAHGNFMIGFPGETPATVDRTLEAVRLSGLDTVSFFLFWVDRDSGARVWLERENWGIEGSGASWRHATMDSAAAEAEVGRAMRTVISDMPRTLIGSEYWIALMMGYGMSREESLALLRAVRDYHLARLRGDASLSADAESRVLAGMRRINSLAAVLAEGAPKI